VSSSTSKTTRYGTTGPPTAGTADVDTLSGSSKVAPCPFGATCDWQFEGCTLLYCRLHPITYQAGELSENSLISEIFVSISEKIRQGFLLNAYAFRDFLIFRLNFQIFFLHCVLHPAHRRLYPSSDFLSDSDRQAINFVVLKSTFLLKFSLVTGSATFDPDFCTPQLTRVLYMLGIDYREWRLCQTLTGRGREVGYRMCLRDCVMASSRVESHSSTDCEDPVVTTCIRARTITYNTTLWLILRSTFCCKDSLPTYEYCIIMI
jgi:hypothetical protein